MRKGKFDILAKARVLPELVNAKPLVSLQNVSREQLERNKIFVELNMIKPRVLIGNDFYNRFLVRAKKKLLSGIWMSTSNIVDIINGEGKISFVENKNFLVEQERNFCGALKESDLGENALCIEALTDGKYFRWVDMARKKES